MTEKRFTVNYRENTRLYEVKDKLHIIDCGGFSIEYSAKKCCDELNALHEENKELKKENAQFDILIKNNQLAYIDLEKKNKQLKYSIKCLEADKMELQQYIKRMQGDVE